MKNIPELLAQKAPHQRGECASGAPAALTGEEALLPIAILVAEALGPAAASYDIKDLRHRHHDEAAIPVAAPTASTPTDQVDNVPKPPCSGWFHPRRRGVG
jgi:hypothetical protein